VQLLPSRETVDLNELSNQFSRLEINRQELRPFHSSVLDFCETFARALREHNEIRSNPALAALAWWLRPGSIAHLKNHWNGLSVSNSTVRVPRGIVFHIPPTNVDTIMVYSWICSALAGNANVIRISSSSDENRVLMEVLFESLARFPKVADTTLFLKYGHDAEVTKILSQADVRVIWGGDHTVQTIRHIEAAPRTIDIPFSNRFSFSLISVDAVARASGSAITQLARDFVNDSYWFDQAACSSPRLIFWLVGSVNADPVIERFESCVIDELERKNIEVAPSTSMSKLVNAFVMAVDGRADKIKRPNHRITIGELSNFETLPRDMPGGGLFYSAKIDNLDQLVPLINRVDQTITYYGIAELQLRAFIDELNGRGIDRLVPIGQALNFDSIWDGFDLLNSCSKLVHLKF